MFSITPTNPLSISQHHHHHHRRKSPLIHHPTTQKPPPVKPISAASSIPSLPPSQQQLYQPFRPPATPLPTQYRTLDTAGRLDVLSNRLGLWFEWAPLIPSLYQEGFTPSSLEEATGISGVEQNRLVVAAQVRETLVQCKTDPETLSFFDTGGSELLYEIRLLSTTQRAAAARFIVSRRADAKSAQELARSMKDFPRRRVDPAWYSFNYSFPGDCLSFMYYRQSKENRNPSPERSAMLQQALDCAESAPAKERIVAEIEDKVGVADNESEREEAVLVPVVRLQIGEVAEAQSVAVVPVADAKGGEREILDAPTECGAVGEFGVVVSDKGWNKWVVLPGWDQVLRLGKKRVAVAFSDARVLPWKVNRWYKEEPILVVADRSKTEVVADDGFYLVVAEGGDGDGGGLKVERGVALAQIGVEKCLGAVVMVVRPPREGNEDELRDEDWE